MNRQPLQQTDPFDQMMFGLRPPGYFQDYPQYPVNYSHQPKLQNANPLLSHFYTPEGKIDYKKIGNGIQQCIKISQQVGPIVKQVSPILSLFKK
ncbi:YppG family protein [Halalkalibacter alkalisediminis]|uniref:YppG family protein n=1 Tax=Halalkalibacter alkalisediminis TaxID=935616 RepID=A0ABV6NN42_9BACI